MPHRTEPMPVKHWSRAGLLLTTWCNAACASCYLACGPTRREDMPVESAVAWWAELAAASPHGCRVHLTGGEPFGDWERLIALCRRARAEGLTGAELVETNAFWATSEPLVRDRLRQLDQAGMGKLNISADPYHQQFVPIERCRLAARVGEEVLGPARVQVRWRDWLDEGFDTADLDERRRRDLFHVYLRRGRERMNGRAAGRLAGALVSMEPAAFADISCSDSLLRSRHVHLMPDGGIMPGTCAGILLGRAGNKPIAEIWRELSHDHAARAVVGPLAAGGPLALLGEAVEHGFVPDRYASKCHLCWEIRRHLASLHLHGDELGPGWMYEE
ncbi:MAG: Radical SAM superfamily protein [Planctomycetes bacterium ADurb.Bin126]|nr:MAG: Radical SAM superfamily protein [Planctomycetes bacterium ADurb.Bin126]HQL75859.1 radical SAM protein [Phycisphaerae bacterium]